MKNKKESSLKENLDFLLEKSKINPDISLKQIFKILSGKGRSLILIFLSLPFCQPIQIPGVSALFGIIIAFIGLRMAFGKRLWIPKRILVKKIPSITVRKITRKSLHFITKMSPYIHSRMTWLCETGINRIVNGFLIFFLGIFLSSPIPFTNLPVGWSLLLLNLGLLEKDGFFVCLGYIGFLLIIIVLIIMTFFII